jgi:hypothetical protein
LILLGAFFSAKYGFSISARVLIYGAYTVCFCTLVAILDPFPAVVLKNVGFKEKDYQG